MCSNFVQIILNEKSLWECEMQKNTTMFEIIVQYFDSIKKEDTVLKLILRTINLNTVDTLLHFWCD